MRTASQLPLIFSEMKAVGIIASAAKIILMALKLKGPRYFIPSFCPTNATPHMIAVTSSTRLPLSCFFIYVSF